MTLISGVLVAAIKELNKKLISDLYAKLKKRLSEKSTPDSGLMAALERLERDPTNAATASTIDAIIAELGIGDDPEVTELVRSIEIETHSTETRRDTANVRGRGNKVAMGGSRIIEK